MSTPHGNYDEEGKLRPLSNDELWPDPQPRRFTRSVNAAAQAELRQLTALLATKAAAAAAASQAKQPLDR